ncbi:MAG: lytic transglycosylase domain-containing protein [Defluviitaleaceae bacterium]|nr:lytic transglycosylase domain-containing protein [Defluviitaleaceae bacterium]
MLKTIKWIVFVVFIIATLAIGGMLAATILYPVRYTAIINEMAEKRDLPPELIFAVIRAESRFRRDAVSHAGAMGLMQLMPDTASWVAGLAGMNDFDIDDIKNPFINIYLGTWYLRWLIDRFGNVDTALAAYNAGHNRVSGWLNNTEHSADGVTLFFIPFTETRNYVERVNNAKPVYRFLLRMFGRFL